MAKAMRQPILSFQKTASAYPILWGTVVFLIGSGFELLATQKILGTHVLSAILIKLDLAPRGGVMTFLYHGCTVLVGLLLIAVSVHGIARAMNSKGRFSLFLSTLLFVTGVMSLISTLVTLIRRDQPHLEWLSVAASLLSFAAYVSVVREVYKLSWINALLAAGLPVLAVSFWVNV